MIHHFTICSDRCGLMQAETECQTNPLCEQHCRRCGIPYRLRIKVIPKDNGSAQLQPMSPDTHKICVHILVKVLHDR
jgi:hypothetical protein